MRSELFTEWSYTSNFTQRANQGESKKFNNIFNQVKDILIEQFAGLPADEGEYSASVQKTLYEMGSKALNTIPELEHIFLSAPNLHNILFDLSKFSLKNDNEVFYPTEEPHGLIECLVSRQQVQGYVPPSRL